MCPIYLTNKQTWDSKPSKVVSEHYASCLYRVGRLPEGITRNNSVVISREWDSWKQGIFFSLDRFYAIYMLLVYFLRHSHFVTQAGVHWHNLSSLQPPPPRLQPPPPPRLRWSSHFSLPSNWELQALTTSWLILFFLEMKSQYVTQACLWPRLVSNSCAQVILPPQPPKVLGLQAWVTVHS